MSSPLDRSLDMELSADGSIRALIREEMSGDTAAAARAEIGEASQDSYSRMIERWIARTVTGAKIEKIVPQDNEANGHVALEIQFAAGQYGKLMQGKLLIFNPAVVSRSASPDLVGQERKLPLVIESAAFAETVKARLPAGFVMDEMPQALNMETSFGNYHAECTLGEGTLLYRRSLVSNDSIFLANNSSRLRNFLSKYGTRNKSARSCWSKNRGGFNFVGGKPTIQKNAVALDDPVKPV